MLPFKLTRIRMILWIVTSTRRGTAYDWSVASLVANRANKGTGFAGSVEPPQSNGARRKMGVTRSAIGRTIFFTCKQSYRKQRAFNLGDFK